MGCKYITLHGDWYRAARPGGDNRNSVQINKRTLESHIKTRGIKGSLFKIVGYINDETYFPFILKWLCDVCGYDFYHDIEENKTTKDKRELFGWFSRIENQEDRTLLDEKLEPIDEKVLNQYYKMPHLVFLKEGISLTAQIDFEISFDLATERIIIPIRDDHSTLVGIKGRATSDLDTNAKYLYLYPTFNRKILYGLHKTHTFIKDTNEVLVVESEKTVQKLWGWGYKNSVALGGKELSLVQERKLRQLGSSITIALDKDVENEHLQKIIDILKLDSKISVIFDTYNLLNKRDSPVDQGKEVFEKLYKKKFMVN